MRAIILVALLLTTGCATTGSSVITVSPPAIHPQLPTPYEICQVDWRILDVDSKPYIAVSYDDNITLALCIKDIERYIKELKSVTCYYRQELTDSQCIKDSNAKN